MENWNQLIERYLQNELSAEARQAFESEMNKNEALRQELELHQLVQQGAKRAAQRMLVKNTASTYHLMRKVYVGSAVTITLVAASLITWMILKGGGESEQNRQNQTEQSPVFQAANTEKAFKNLAVELLTWQGMDSVFLTKGGTLLAVPEGCLLKEGKPYQGQAVISWQEATRAADIMQAGLSTTSGDRLLETQGMFSFKAYTPEGAELKLSETKGIYVQVPVSEYKKDMQLFNGQALPNGQIDWVNPVPLEKVPVPVDMSMLHFYPPGYERHLDQEKWKTDKKSRDSLYLSFEQEGGAELIVNDLKAVPTGENSEPFASANQAMRTSEEIFTDNRYREIKPGLIEVTTYIYAPEYLLYKEGSFGVSLPDPKKGRIVGEQTVKGYNNQMKVNGEDFSYYTTNFSITYRVMIPQQETTINLPILFNGTQADIRSGRNVTLKTYREQMNMLITPYKDQQPETDDFRGIRPSLVLAFWQPKMNGTILATREFEARMKAIHATCNPQVLKHYLNSLNEPLWKTDEKVAKMGYPQFNSFAAERVGALQKESAYVEMLAEFLTNAQKTLHEKALDDIRIHEKLNAEITRKYREDAQQNQIDNEQRKSGLLQQEYKYNLADVARQLGKTVGFQIHGGGTIVNIDKYVMDATVSRTTTEITDPETGKKAKITYNAFGLTVKNPESFDQLYMYLLPQELNSFHRIDPKGKRFDYPLNGTIRYHLAVIGVNAQGYFLYTAEQIAQKEFGNITLTKISEAEFRKQLEQLNQSRNPQAESIIPELDWLRTEQKYQVHLLRQREIMAFRSRLFPLIYPCGLYEWGYTPVADPLVK